MKGWLFKEIHEPLDLIERPDPAVGKGEIGIDVKGAGLCHSDVGFIDGVTTAALSYYPIILGHELAGVVNAVGEGVTEFKVGDRVACRAGVTGPGGSCDGAYANKTVVPAELCTVVPDEVPWIQAAAATDAGITSYHAIVETAGVKAGDKVGIVGLGGLGMNAVQIAKALGAKVYGAEISEKARTAAEKFGLEKIVSDVRELKEDNLDIIIDFAGFDSTVSGSIDTVKPCGTVVIIGLGQAASTINTFNFVFNQITVKASVGGTVEDLKGVYKLMSEKKLDILASPITFDEIPDGLNRLREGKVTGRLVALMD